MKEIKDKLKEQFKAITFDEWKKSAQKSIKSDIDDVLLFEPIDGVKLRGIYTADEIQDISERIINSNNDADDSFKTINILEYGEKGASSDIEIGLILSHIENNSTGKFNYKVSIDNNFFVSVAIFRVLNLILGNYKKANSEFDFIISACSINYNKSITDIENNLIRLTLEAASAYIGGADKIELLPYDSLKQEETNQLSKRITNNIEKILVEESYINKVLDPMSGSYFIEKLTDSLADRAYEMFEQIENKGAYGSEEAEDYINSLIEKKSKQDSEELNTLKKKFIGVNIYQNSKKDLEGVKIKNHRPAFDFEKLKQIFDESAPRIYIANFNDDRSELRPLLNTLNTFNIEFESSIPFELVEDAYNSVKLFDPDLVILNTKEENIVRILNNELSNYKVVPLSNIATKGLKESASSLINLLNENE